MRLLVLSIAACAAAKAGEIQGVVLEHVTGLPLARTRVILQPVPQPGGGEVKSREMRSGRSGQFTFSGVADGLHLLTAVRDGYFPAGHGQRRPSGHGVPIRVSRDSTLFSELRMRRKGAITGRVLDENGVGISGVPVLAYRARLPFRSAGRGVSDDRGVYRITGLEPGRYWVRTAAHRLEDGSGRLPTFGSESREVREARIHVVRLDTDTTDADVRPDPGNLVSLGGMLICGPPGAAVTVTLSTETGRRTGQSGCGGAFSFDALSPGMYELFAILPGPNYSGFAEVYADRPETGVNLTLGPPASVTFQVRLDGVTARADEVKISLVARRQDLSETESEQPVATPRATLAPGRWEMRGTVGPGHYVQSIASDFRAPRRRAAPENHPDWYEVFIESRGTSLILTSVSSQAGEIQGTVKDAGAVVAGTPVFLWPTTESARRSLGGPKQVLSDTGGRFRFDGLPPSDYRLLASFDVSEIEEEVLDEARAATVQAKPSQTAVVELVLWNAP